MRVAANLRGILRIRLRLHRSWAVAFVLITATVATQFPEAYPLWLRIVLGIAASLLFLLSISAHEFARSFMAISKGIPVKSVTLFAFVGVTNIPKEATLPSLELLIGATGLLSCLFVAGIFYGIYIVLVSAGSIIAAGLIQWLAFINLMLSFFSFIPAFPLDGGKILRALLWRASGNYSRATRISSWTGQGIGLLFIAGGIAVLIITRQWFVGLLLAFAGWGLRSAAVHGHRQAILLEILQSVTARDIMTKEYTLINQQLNLGQLVRDYVLVTGQHYFVVIDDAKLQGIATIHDMKSIPKGRWNSTRIGEIMTPASELKTAHPQQLAANLIEQMDELKINQVPVLENDKVIGIVTRDSLTRLVKTRAELGM